MVAQGQVTGDSSTVEPDMDRRKATEARCPGRRLDVVEEGEEPREQEVGELGSAPTVAESSVFKTEVPEAIEEVVYNSSSVFYIPPEVLTFAPLATQDISLRQISQLPNKHPFPTEPQLQHQQQQ